MWTLIPLGCKRIQTASEFLLIGKVDDRETFALEDAEPLLNLVHPGTVHRRKMKLPTRVSGEPFQDLLAFMHADVVEYNVDGSDGRRDDCLDLLKKGNELDLPFTAGGAMVDMAGARIEGRKEVERSVAFVFVFDSDRCCWRSRRGGCQTRSGLETGFLIGAQNHLMRAERSGIKIGDIADSGGKSRITRDLG